MAINIGGVHVMLAHEEGVFQVLFSFEVSIAGEPLPTSSIQALDRREGAHLHGEGVCVNPICSVWHLSANLIWKRRDRRFRGTSRPGQVDT